MEPYTLLVGNDINNIDPGKSWKDILDEIVNYCGLTDIAQENKPFPILYDEIFLSALKQKEWDEYEVKHYIANLTTAIGENEIHQRIRELSLPHIMTTNYDYTIQGQAPAKNEGLVLERLYSIFRSHLIGETRYWHLHGECNYPASINLGYEHYCGQLQNMRNYTVTGTQYRSDGLQKRSLMSRLKSGQRLNDQSWIDLFFTTDIHILGLKLDFVETDLWWLLTYRARQKFYKKTGRGFDILNKIRYYIPAAYVAAAEPKLQVLDANDVEVVTISGPKGLPYYHEVLNRVERSANESRA
jgi:hypothetical protein